MDLVSLISKTERIGERSANVTDRQTDRQTDRHEPLGFYIINRWTAKTTS